MFKIQLLRPHTSDQRGNQTSKRADEHENTKFFQVEFKLFFSFKHGLLDVGRMGQSEMKIDKVSNGNQEAATGEIRALISRELYKVQVIY